MHPNYNPHEAAFLNEIFLVFWLKEKIFGFPEGVCVCDFCCCCFGVLQTNIQLAFLVIEGRSTVTATLTHSHRHNYFISARGGSYVVDTTLNPCNFCLSGRCHFHTPKRCKLHQLKQQCRPALRLGTVLDPLKLLGVMCAQQLARDYQKREREGLHR